MYALRSHQNVNDQARSPHPAPTLPHTYAKPSPVGKERVPRGIVVGRVAQRLFRLHAGSAAKAAFNGAAAEAAPKAQAKAKALKGWVENVPMMTIEGQPLSENVKKARDAAIKLAMETSCVALQRLGTELCASQLDTYTERLSTMESEPTSLQNFSEHLDKLKAPWDDAGWTDHTWRAGTPRQRNGGANGAESRCPRQSPRARHQISRGRKQMQISGRRQIAA